MSNPAPKLIVFVTGAFIGNSCWGDWVAYFESHGYNCTAPARPHKNVRPKELPNRHPHIGIASNRRADITNHFATIVAALTDRPIMIGHSVGGLVVQLLLGRWLGAAGIAIHSFPSRSVCTCRFSFIESVWEALSFSTSTRKTYRVLFKKLKYAFANSMTYELQKELYNRYATPESKRVVRDAFRWVAKMDLRKPHVPLIFASGSNNRIKPAS